MGLKSHAGTSVCIADLADVPCLRDEVVEINAELWGELTDLEPKEMAQLFPVEKSSNGLPLTLVASIDGKLAGCVSLREETMGMIKHPEAYLPGKSPWLSNMWVAERARGQKLASCLTEDLERRARELGFSQIYSSAGQSDSLYHKLGYKEIGRKPLKNLTIHLIRKDLSAPSAVPQVFGSEGRAE